MTINILNRRERVILEGMAADTADASQLRRAQALLWLDEEESAEEISQRLGVSRRTIYNWSSRFEKRREVTLADRLLDGERGGRPRTARGIIDPLIDEIIELDPREFGYRSTVWVAALLVHYLWDFHQISVSRQSVSITIERLRIRWKRPRHPLSLRPEAWRQAKGG
jgi:transposase